jgi:hypothetical protein
MKLKFAIFLLGISISLALPAQRQSDLTKFVKISDHAAGTISQIDSLSQILGKRFIGIANNVHSETHREIQSFFKKFKGAKENDSYNIYPERLNQNHLTIQYINYSYHYGWAGQGVDSVFNKAVLTALIFIPAFDIFNKGAAVNTICFKVTMELYSEGETKSNKNYKNKEKIVAIKHIEI